MEDAPGLDLLALIDRLDDLMTNAKRVPMTVQIRVDREQVFDILDQMRMAIPTEIKRARAQLPDPALEALRLRYASGEVARDEYLAAQADLGGAPPASA